MLTLNECVEKQCAKAVLTRADMYMVNFKCPRCCNTIVSKAGAVFVGGRRSNYCDECGQKLDWSVVV